MVWHWNKDKASWSSEWDTQYNIRQVHDISSLDKIIEEFTHFSENAVSPGRIHFFETFWGVDQSPGIHCEIG